MSLAEEDTDLTEDSPNNTLVQRNSAQWCRQMNEKTTRPLVNEKSPTEFQDTSMNSRTKWLHVYFAFVAAYGSLGFGLSVVFSSPFLEQMFQVSNFTLWTDGFQQCIYQNLVGPLMPFGAVVGGFLSSLCVGVLGLVTPMLAGAVVFVAGWSMIGVSWFVSSPIVFRDLILAGRFLTGLATGLVASTIPVSSWKPLLQQLFLKW